MILADICAVMSLVNIIEEGGLSTSRGTDNNAESHGETLSVK